MCFREPAQRWDGGEELPGGEGIFLEMRTS